MTTHSNRLWSNEWEQFVRHNDNAQFFKSSWFESDSNEWMGICRRIGENVSLNERFLRVSGEAIEIQSLHIIHFVA